MKTKKVLTDFGKIIQTRKRLAKVKSLTAINQFRRTITKYQERISENIIACIPFMNRYVQIESHGKSIIVGLCPKGIRCHVTTIRKLKSFKDLIFRYNPYNEYEQLAKLHFTNGYSVNVSTKHADSKLYYEVSVYRNGQLCCEPTIPYGRNMYCNENVVERILKQVQSL